MRGPLLKIVVIGGIILPIAITLLPWGKCQSMSGRESPEVVKLPKPQHDSKTSIEKTLAKRRSVRDYKNEPLTLAQVSQLLWAAQGVTNPRGFRTAPSAGATYPLETYVVVGNVTNLSPGIYKYRPQKHELIRTVRGDKREELSSAALGQSWVRQAPVVMVFGAIYERTTGRYGDRGIMYVHMEAGHAAQNVSLQAISLGLGTVMVGAFHDHSVKRIMNLKTDEKPLYIVPIGKPS